MRIILAVLLAMTLSACSRVSREDVIGTYVLDNDTSGYSIELKSDGTYVHAYLGKDGKRGVQVGKWEWDKDDADNPIALDDFQAFPNSCPPFRGRFQDLGAAWPSRGTLFCLQPERSFKGIRFPIGDPDSPLHYFVRRDSQPH